MTDLPRPEVPGQRTQADRDAANALLNARNCITHEETPGHAELNVGTDSEPRMLPRSEAWQHSYAMWVLIDLDGDHARLVTTSARCREEAARKRPRKRRWRSRELALAADLCEQAARMVEEAGAVGDDKARRRLLAGCKRETTMIAIGVLPTVAESAADDYQRALREIDEEP
jgi:hypothetical protein